MGNAVVVPEEETIVMMHVKHRYGSPPSRLEIVTFADTDVLKRYLDIAYHLFAIEQNNWISYPSDSSYTVINAGQGESYSLLIVRVYDCGVHENESRRGKVVAMVASYGPCWRFVSPGPRRRNTLPFFPKRTTYTASCGTLLVIPRHPSSACRDSSLHWIGGALRG